MIIFAISILVLICVVSLMTKKSNDRQENPIIKQKIMTDDEKLTQAKDALSQQLSYYKEFITDEDCKKVVDYWNLRSKGFATYDKYIELKHNLYEELSNRKELSEKLKDEKNKQARERIFAKITYGEKVLLSFGDHTGCNWIELEKELEGENK